MGLSVAERNKRKRERKKREREEKRKQQELDETKKKEEQENGGTTKTTETGATPEDVEIEYVAEPILSEEVEGLRKFWDLVPSLDTTESSSAQASVLVPSARHDDDDDDAAQDRTTAMSKRKLREMLRPSVADLKRRVARPELVEAHDVTATDPEFLLELKSVPGTVPVPRNWGRKRKYLQGKRGFEKPPFQLPDFILKTGIAAVRDAAAEDQAKMTIRQKNRARVSGKTGAVDVDYRTLYDAFFKHQTKPKNLTQFGDMYYEGKEMEVDTNRRPGEFSSKLRDALGMTSETAPPPWLLNMQRYGPPPSYPSLKIPGLNAPLPTPECQYGYHPGGWGKPPIDPYGRPLYGGNPFDPPGSDAHKDDQANLVTSDGKALGKMEWGALPTGYAEESEDEEEEEEEESSDEDMEDSEEEVEQAEPEVAAQSGGLESVLPPPTSAIPTGPVSLRKDAGGDETPAPPKHLYQVIEQKQASMEGNAVFASDVQYVVPGSAAAAQTASKPPEGAESILAKSLPNSKSSKRKRKTDDDDEDEDGLDKNFKF